MWTEQRKIECIDAAYYQNGYNHFTTVNLTNWDMSNRTMSLLIAQQWYCDDEGAEKP
jgi:hypothetical protein